MHYQKGNLMSRRRVLIFNHFAIPPNDAGGTRHAELFGQLADWDSLIVAARTSRPLLNTVRHTDGFRFVPVLPYTHNGWARVANWISYAVLATILSLLDFRRRPHLTYASSPHLLAGLAGAVVATVFRTPLILEIRDMWPKVLVDMGKLTEGSVVYRVLTRLERWLYRRADKIVVLAPGVRTALTESGIPKSKVLLIPNAADPKYFDVRVSRESARALYGFNKLTFVYTGAHGPANGLDLLLQAAAEVQIEQHHVEIVLVGDGLNKQALEAQANCLGLKNVRFLDPIPKSDVPTLLHAADVGIHCLADVPLFRYGVSPNKVFDYMAAGKPVLTNNPGDVSALVEGACGGIAVPPTGLAEGIARVASATAEQRTLWGAQGQQFMSENQSRQAMVERLRQLVDGFVPPAP